MCPGMICCHRHAMHAAPMHGMAIPGADSDSGHLHFSASSCVFISNLFLRRSRNPRPAFGMENDLMRTRLSNPNRVTYCPVSHTALA